MTAKKYPHLTPKLLAEAERENRLGDFMLATSTGKVLHALEFCRVQNDGARSCEGHGAVSRRACARFSQTDPGRMERPLWRRKTGYGRYQTPKPVKAHPRTSYTSTSRADVRCMASVPA